MDARVFSAMYGGINIDYLLPLLLQGSIPSYEEVLPGPSVLKLMEQVQFPLQETEIFALVLSGVSMESFDLPQQFV